jgi:hypothetical protein
MKQLEEVSGDCACLIMINLVDWKLALESKEITDHCLRQEEITQNKLKKKNVSYETSS